MPVVPSDAAWRKIVQTVQRLERQYQDLRSRLVGARHASGASIRFIKFSLAAELRRSQTKRANHVEWKDEPKVEKLQVTEPGHMPSDLRAPSGTNGLAMWSPAGWIVIDLDCEALEPHDGDIQEDNEEED